MLTWIVLAIIILIALVLLISVAAMGKSKMPPTDYYMLFIIGIIFTGAGVPLMVSSDMPSMLFLGIVFMLIGIFHRKEWEKNHNANQWKNLTKAQRIQKKIMMWTLLGIMVIGLAALVATFFLIV
jgi:hypothetical protein